MKKYVLILLLSTPALAAHRVTLAWNASISTDVDHYKVYRSFVPGGPYALMGSVGAGMLTFTNGSNPGGTPLIEGQTYCYVVTAIAGLQESGFSNEACVVIPVTPAPPTNVQTITF